jgi:hypothetical protein
MFLLSLDPGKVSGFAVFDLRTAWLVACGLSSNDAKYFYKIFTSYRVTHTIAELPEVYRPKHSKGNPNDLIPLAVECGILGGLAYAFGVQTKNQCLVLPKKWKGQLPKRVTKKRFQNQMNRTERAVTEAASRLIPGPTTGKNSLHHNMWDALGIGLYGIGKLGVKKWRQQ